MPDNGNNSVVFQKEEEEHTDDGYSEEGRITSHDGASDSEARVKCAICSKVFPSKLFKHHIKVHDVQVKSHRGENS